MQKKGTVIDFKTETNPPKKKVKIRDLEDGRSTYWIEFRNDLQYAAFLLEKGDEIKVTGFSNARESIHNTHNNIIAEKVERI